MTYCRKCGNMLSPGDIYCNNCGASIKAEKIECLDCGTFVEADSQFCPNCGFGILEARKCEAKLNNNRKSWRKH